MQTASVPYNTHSIRCGSCGQGVAATILSIDQHRHGDTSGCLWLQCPACLQGSVMLSNGAVHPVSPAGGSVQHLPDDVAQAWREARTAHAVAAYTASEMMCRKILMHLAVDVGNATPGKSFVEYVDVLVTGGYVTAGLRPVVDAVRVRGNGANHELPASTEQDSLRTLRVTEYLLRGTYELPAIH